MMLCQYLRTKVDHPGRVQSDSGDPSTLELYMPSSTSGYLSLETEDNMVPIEIDMRHK